MAKRELERIRAIRKNTSEDATYGFFQFSQQDLLGMAENILAGEIAATDNQYIEAEEYLREAIRLEDRLPYSEPEPWPIPARHVLGAVLLEAGQAADAEIVYREDLQNYPENGWSLKGLVLSLEAQGKSAEAEKTRLEFEKAWQRADVYLKASRF
jgi:tetratricopeptide (TPR) repeat protein